MMLREPRIIGRCSAPMCKWKQSVQKCVERNYGFVYLTVAYLLI